MLLDGKVALITGASKGIGKAIALQYAEQGASVAIVAGNEEAMRIVRNEIEAIRGASQDENGMPAARYYICDVSKYDAVKNTVEEVIADFGHIDILVNNAGIVRDKLLLQMKEEDFDDVIGVNLKGAFHLIRHTFSHFSKRRSGRIINITSVSALLGTAGQANYVSSKAGLIGLTKTTARELAGRGVTCNAIAPGYIETEMTAALPGSVQERYLEQIPLKRFGAMEDVANLAVFLASDGAAYITGEIIRVDGGLCM